MPEEVQSDAKEDPGRRQGSIPHNTRLTSNSLTKNNPKPGQEQIWVCSCGGVPGCSFCGKSGTQSRGVTERGCAHPGAHHTWLLALGRAGREGQGRLRTRARGE